jgi:hypothetical protein
MDQRKRHTSWAVSKLLKKGVFAASDCASRMKTRINGCTTDPRRSSMCMGLSPATESGSCWECCWRTSASIGWSGLESSKFGRLRWYVDTHAALANRVSAVAGRLLLLRSGCPHSLRLYALHSPSQLARANVCKLRTLALYVPCVSPFRVCLRSVPRCLRPHRSVREVADPTCSP